MNVLFFILVTLFLIVVQTVIFPFFLIFPQCFDLLIIDILFLSLISTHYSVIFAIIFIGLIMDSLSGAPFFHYIFSYLWIYIIVHLVKQLLFKKSAFFILILSVASVLIQHGFLLFSAFVKHDSANILIFNLMPLAHQVFWGLIFIPIGVWLLGIFFETWNNMIKYFQKRIAKNAEWYLD